MKKLLIAISVIAIVAMLSAVMAFALTSNEAPEEADVVEAPVDDAVVEEGVFYTLSNDEKELLANPTTENLEKIFAAFDEIIDENDEIVLERYMEGAEKTDGGKYSVKTTESSAELKVGMLVSAYIANMPEAVYYTDSAVGGGARILPKYYVSFDFAKYGYENVEDYINDCRRGDCKFGDNTFVISIPKIDMYLAKGEDFMDPNPNLLSFINEKDVFDTRYPTVVFDDEEKT